MGLSIFQIDRLDAPLDRVMERVIRIPKGRRLLVNNAQKKIVILLDGAVEAMVNDRVVGEMRSGDALVLPGACRQAWIPLDRGREMRMHVLIVLFSPRLFPCEESLLRAVPIADINADESPEHFFRRHFDGVQLRRGVLSPAVMEWSKELRREAEEKKEGYRLRVVAYTLLLLSEIARRETSLVTLSRESMSRQAWIVEEAKNFLLEHYAEKLTLDEVAWHLRLSGEHLARTFHKETGLTIFGYIQYLRLERAKTQLACTRLTVDEIARQAGFGTAAALCRIFKKSCEMTPLTYRLRIASQFGFTPSLTEEIV